jgi:hypothetical protein
MLLGAAIAIAAVQGVPATNLADLPAVFAQACLDGQVRFSRGQAQLVSAAALPDNLRHAVARSGTGQIWRLATPGQTFLYVLNEARPGAKRCGLASDILPFADARRRLEARVGEPGPHGQPATEWVNVPDGYVATATRLGSFSITQIRWLSPKEHRRLILETRMLGVPVKATRKED